MKTVIAISVFSVVFLVRAYGGDCEQNLIDLEEISRLVSEGKFPLPYRHPVDLDGLSDAQRAVVHSIHENIRSMYSGQPLTYLWSVTKKSKRLTDLLPRDSSLAHALVCAAIALQTPSFVAEFFAAWAADSFRLKRRGSSSDAHLGPAEVLPALGQRLAAYEIPVVEVNQATELSRRKFRKLIRRGVPLELGFSQQGEGTIEGLHGPFPHLVQIAMLAPILSQAEGAPGLGSYFNYFGTARGIHFWHHFLDGGGRNAASDLARNPFFITHRLLPLLGITETTIPALRSIFPERFGM